jgi:glycosyltransferase involved in cell wall biosynthesis
VRVLVVNKYHKLTGGADRYALDLPRLLMSHGHETAFLSMDQPDNWPADYPLYTVPSGLTNKTWKGAGAGERLSAYLHGVYHRGAGAVMAKAISEFRPDVVHCQNLFYQLSPSVIRAARRAGVTVIQTLHDYQPVCANNVLFTHGHLCEECRPRRFHSILKNRCYNDSASASFLAFSAKVVHTMFGLYPQGVDRFIAPSRFLKAEIESFGVPMAPIDQLNYFLEPAAYEPQFDPGSYLLFFGQLLKHKGVYTLLTAYERLGMDVPLVIAGTGPEETGIDRVIAQRSLKGVRRVGYKKGADLFDLIRGARLVIVPSEWYENQPYAVLEAMALGKPVAASSIGGIPEMVDDRVGRLFPPGDATALADVLRELVSDERCLREAGKAARQRVLANHDPAEHIKRLEEIYRIAIKQSSTIPG